MTCLVEYSKIVSKVLLFGASHLIALLAASGEPRVGSFPKPLGPFFQRFQSAHFEIFSDAAPDVVRRVEVLAEDTFRAVDLWASRLDVARPKRSEYMRIVLFKEEPAFNEFILASGLRANPEVPGYFDERRNYCAILDIAGLSSIRRKRDELFIARKEIPSFSASNVSEDQRRRRLQQIRGIEKQLAEHERAINSTVIRHEIAHLVLFNFGLQRADDKNRRWLKEGLAMQFENPDGINHYRLADFQAIPILRQKQLLGKLISDPSCIGPGAEKPAEAYALAWSVVSYLSTEQTSVFKQYLTDTRSQRLENEPAEFEHRFGPIDDAFVRRLDEFVRRFDS